METLILIIIILAAIDLGLTLLWTWRWNSQKCVKKFEKKVPFETIERNVLIRKTVKSFGLYAGIIFGYFVVCLIQLGLFMIHRWLGYFVVLSLAIAITKHIRDNAETSNQKITEITSGYNEALLKKVAVKHD